MSAAARRTLCMVMKCQMRFDMVDEPGHFHGHNADKKNQRRNSVFNPGLGASVTAGAGMEALNTRGERVIQVLGEEKKFTRDDMVALGYDTYILPADVIVPLLTEASRTRMKDEKLRG